MTFSTFSPIFLRRRAEILSQDWPNSPRLHKTVPTIWDTPRRWKVMNLTRGDSSLVVALMVGSSFTDDDLKQDPAALAEKEPGFRVSRIEQERERGLPPQASSGLMRKDASATSGSGGPSPSWPERSLRKDTILSSQMPRDVSRRSSNAHWGRDLPGPPGPTCPMRLPGRRIGPGPAPRQTGLRIVRVLLVLS